MENEVTVNIRGKNIPINLLDLKDKYITNNGKLSDLMIDLDKVPMDELLKESEEVYKDYLRKDEE